MYSSNFDSVRKNVNVNEMKKMVEDLWSLFKKDYEESNDTKFSQMTFRIIHELAVWLEDDSIKYAAVCEKLLELNLAENHSNRKEEIISWLEEESELAATLEFLDFGQVAATSEND
jgi:hypothetical protein